MVQLLLCLVLGFVVTSVLVLDNMWTMVFNFGSWWEEFTGFPWWVQVLGLLMFAGGFYSTSGLKND